MKNHTNFYWEITRMKLSKKHFLKNVIFHSKNLLGEAPKNLKKSLGKSIQTKNHTSFYWENPTKRNIEKTMWQNRLISKKNTHWRDVAIKVWISMPFLGLSGGFAEWKKGMHFGAQVWISIPFLGLSGGFAARKKGMRFGARVWISLVITLFGCW